MEKTTKREKLAVRQRIRQAWLGLPENWRTHLLSGIKTFISTFLTELTAMAITSTGFTLSRFTLIAALNVAIRAVVVNPATNAVIVNTAPDPKK